MNHLLNLPSYKNFLLGAGDGFDAGFIAAIVEGRSMNEAIHHGNAVAALVITKKGAMTALPSRRQLDRFLIKTTEA